MYKRQVFNGIYWKRLLENGLPRGTEGRIALPIAGPDGPAKKVVFDLIDELGFEPIDGGSLDDSWRQQPGTPVYGKDFDAARAMTALAEASPERTEAFKADSA